MRLPLQALDPTRNCYAGPETITAKLPCAFRRKVAGIAFAGFVGKETMGPAIALRLRQHLTLTPQVQQALRLLQMSAMEFAQEMEEALTSNPFLEENPDAPAPVTPRDNAVEEVVLPQEPAGIPSERDQDDWGGATDAQPSLQEHLREQLRMSRIGDRDRALAEMVIEIGR